MAVEMGDPLAHELALVALNDAQGEVLGEARLVCRVSVFADGESSPVDRFALRRGDVHVVERRLAVGVHAGRLTVPSASSQATKRPLWYSETVSMSRSRMASSAVWALPSYIGVQCSPRRNENWLV